MGVKSSESGENWCHESGEERLGIASGMILHALLSRSRWRSPVSIWQDLIGLGAMAMASLGIGLAVNALRPQPLALVYASPRARLDAVVAGMPPGSPASRQPATAPRQSPTIGLDEFQDFVLARKGLSIDARPRAIYDVGHVPGAINLPREDFERGYAGVRARIEPGKEQIIVVYCSEADCQDAELVAGALRRLGYGRSLVFKEGWEEWQRAGLPQETGHPP